MKNWMSLRGNFIENKNKIIFQGLNQQSIDDSVSNNLLISLRPIPDGIILFEDMISNGLIETTLEFEKFDKGDFAQIVFNYQSDSYYMCAGVANSQAKYGFNLVNMNNLNTINATGAMDELPINKFDIKLHLMGSFLELYINGIKVLTSAIPFWVNCTQVGIWIKSKGKVFIRDFKTDYTRPEIFVVSQFGGDYDILYDEVIKPVCEGLNYSPIRGDEVVSYTLILNDIITSIRNSAIVIADITPDNPNVFYEVGYAHALNKPTILLCEKAIRDKLPFDVSGFRTIFYDNSIGGKRKVEEKLKKYLQNISNPIYNMGR